jgi:predicted Zn-dependent protease
MKLAFYIVFCLFINFTPAMADENLDYVIQTLTDREIYRNLSEMETFYYGHDYTDDGLNKRLSRLEKTVFHYRKKRSGYKNRYLELYNHYQSKKSPFYNKKSTNKVLSDSELSLLALMETRFFGLDKDQYSIEERINQLELAVFGSKQTGTIQERYELLSKNTPITVKGINIRKDGKTIVSFRPDYNSPPVPQSPHSKIFTPLQIKYNPTTGDYFNNIIKNSTGEILRWKDFPLYVYVHSTQEYDQQISKAAIEFWQSKLPIHQTKYYKSADILIDWTSRGDYITVPIIANIEGKQQIKVLINLGGIKETEDKKTLPSFIMHQIGHALGIWGHSDNPKDIMYPTGSMGVNDINVKTDESWIYKPITIETTRPVITDRDLNTLVRIYQTPTSFEKIISGWK